MRTPCSSRSGAPGHAGDSDVDVHPDLEYVDRFVHGAIHHQTNKKLMQGTLAISAGDLGHRISHDGADEFSELARCFNKMSAILLSQRDDLLEIQSSLERKNDQLTMEIRERKQAEEEARQHQARLAHVLRLNTVNEMATSIAHEINNPLSAIINYTRGCERRLVSGEIDKPVLKDTLERSVRRRREPRKSSAASVILRAE